MNKPKDSWSEEGLPMSSMKVICRRSDKRLVKSKRSDSALMRF